MGLGDKPTPGKAFKAGATDVSFPEHISFSRWTFGFFFSSEGLCLLVSVLFACLNTGFGGCVVPFERGLNALLAFPLSLNMDRSQAADKLQARWRGGARKVQPKLC